MKLQTIKDTDIRKTARDLLIYLIVNVIAFVGGETANIGGIVFIAIITASLIAYLMLNKKQRTALIELWSFIEKISKENVNVQEILNKSHEEELRSLENDIAEQFNVTVAALSGELNNLIRLVVEKDERVASKINLLSTMKWRKR